MQVLRKILFPISLVYAMIVYLRNYLYDVGFFKSKSFKTPTICVGNLSVGGTGKTPMVEFLVSELQEEFKVAVLSRGYNRKSRGFVFAGSDATVETLGDEPFQIHSKFSGVAVAVDADRSNGIAMLKEEINPDLIVLDDAFQHRKVKPNVSILLTAYGDLYIDDWYLPTGNLRDSKRESKRADLIIVTKCPKDIDKDEMESIKRKLDPETDQDVLFGSLSYSPIIKGVEEDMSLAQLKSKKVTLVTGIANPEPLVTYLKKEGIAFEHLKFKDHHFFTDGELEKLRKKEFILTTEKDYVRLKDKLKNIYFISIAHEFSDADRKILKNRLEAVTSPDS